MFLLAIVPGLDSLKIGCFLKVVAVNKNRPFLPFLSSEWIPLQVLLDWKMGTMVASLRCQRKEKVCALA
jgi:hypothetical protein